VPTVEEGAVPTTACINQDRECCVGELDIAVRNCSAWVAYRLVPTPACNMGYCVGEGVPCPEGLASANGYTPCDCKWMEGGGLTRGRVYGEGDYGERGSPIYTQHVYS
jgi:hypothetical protein